MLRLVGEFDVRSCPTCNGLGKVPCPRNIGVRTLNGGRPIDTPGEGRPIPCPECRGAKMSIAVLANESFQHAAEPRRPMAHE